MNIKQMLTDLESELSQDSPDSLVKLNIRNPRRVTRKMLQDLIVDLPERDECCNFCHTISKSNVAMSKNSASLRNLIDSRFPVKEHLSKDALLSIGEHLSIKQKEEPPAEAENIKFDAVVEDAIEDGIENAIESYVEDSIKEDQEEGDDSEDVHRVQDDFNKAMDKKLDMLIEITQALGDNSQKALEMSSLVKEKMSDYSKKIDVVTVDNIDNMKKIDHLGRVLEMMNKEEVENFSPKKTGNPSKKKQKPVTRDSAEFIRTMLGIRD